MERNFTGTVCRNMLQYFLIPPFDQDYQDGSIFFQQDGAPPHFHGEVCSYLNIYFLNLWVGQVGTIVCPPQSPSLAPLDFFLQGIVKDKVYFPPLPSNVHDL
jgi:hypothetical protein